MQTQTAFIPKISVQPQPEWSWTQKLVLHRTQPQCLILEIIGLMWFLYSFASHAWVAAIAIVVGTRALEFLLVNKPNYSEIAQTTLGKLALLHLHPINLIVQFVGGVIFLFGLWYHTTPTLLAGLSLIVLGHWVGWSQVHPALANR